MYFSLKHWSNEEAQKKISELKKLLKKKGYSKLKREHINGCFQEYYTLTALQPEQEKTSSVSVITGGKAPANSITPENYERFIEYLNTTEVPATPPSIFTNLTYIN